MFIQLGCISGGIADATPITSCSMQGIAITLRNSTVSAIQPYLSTVNKVSEIPSIGDTARSSTNYYVSDNTDILIAASVNALDNGDVLDTDYEVPAPFVDWVNMGTVSEVGLRLGVATNDTLSAYPSPEQVDFQQNFSGEDSLTLLKRYYASTGNITTVGGGTKILLEDVESITLPLHGSTVAGDTVILVVMSELSLAVPSGFSWDFTDNVKGNIYNLTALERNTQLTLFRKVVNSGDVTNGEFTVTTFGASM